MKHEVGRRVLPDGSILVQSEEAIAGDFGMRQSFETLPPEAKSEEAAGIAELTPGQVILEIAAKQADEGTLRVDY